MELVVSQYGVFLGKKSERVVVRAKGKTVQEVPLAGLEQINFLGEGAALSTDLIKECAERGVQINLLSHSGRPHAKLSAPTLTATIHTRREQLLAYGDERGTLLAKAFVHAKLQNQANLLRYFAKYRRTAAPDKFTFLMEKVEKIWAYREELAEIPEREPIDEVRTQILSVEAHAASEYWQGFAALLEPRYDFPGREHRGASDPVNSLLNYCYGILYSRIWGAVMLAGLEPFAGYLHADRSGKPSLILDLIEEFRQPVSDRVVLAYLGQGCEVKMDADKLDEGTRQLITRRLYDRLDAQERFAGKKLPIKSIIQRQARRLASYLRREEEYVPFVCDW